MAQAESAFSTLITTKRNFLVRALGFTAAGATLSVPIVTIADARAKMDHHIEGLQAAMFDYYGGADIKFIPCIHGPESVDAGGAGDGLFFLIGKRGRYANAPELYKRCRR